MTTKRAQGEPQAFAELDEMVGEFLLESHEGLDRTDQDLLALEQDPASAEAIARIFRTMHTIKGTCGFLGFTKTEAVAHAAETLLGGLRDQEYSVTPSVVTALLSAGDAIRTILGQIEATGAEGAGDYRRVIAALGRLGGSRRQSGRPRSTGGPKTPNPRRKPSAAASPARENAARAKGPVVRATRANAPRAKLQRAKTTKPPTADAPDQHSEVHGVIDSAIRVDVGLLDGLMTLVGELVLARNQLMQRTTIQQDPVLSTTAQRLDVITTELQARIMKTRMQPIGTLWIKYPRVARDLAIECGKQVRIETDGEDTELDRSLIEAIRDPLTHIVRNCVDHGIELPAARKKAGKPPEGVVLIRAYHEGGQVIIEIGDDGNGIDPADVLAAAVRSGIVAAYAAAQTGEREALNLIFTPGLSTAQEVTKLSGRGVGMDVVRANVERVGGTVDVQSRPGEGTTFKIKIPLTLAIIPALLVTAAGDRYAIPQVNLLELVRIEGDDVSRAIETIQGVPVYRLRGRLLPLVSLAAELDPEDTLETARRAARAALDTAGPDADGEAAGGAGVHPAEDEAGHDVNIVVLQADDRRFGLMVDAISDSAEIVVKPLGRDLKAIGVFAGATIMGDGRVGLILDVMGLAQRAHVVDQVRDRATHRPAAEDAADEDTTALLLFADERGGRMALALDLVDRLEEFPRNAIERAGLQSVIQYRDEILPLVDVDGLLTERRSRSRTLASAPDASADPPDEYRADDDTIQVIVHRHRDRRIGVVVNRIIDIVESRMDLQPASRPGVSGTLVIHDRVTEVLDLPGLLAASGRARKNVRTEVSA
jgi:two-component system chemotaxis sensor kinase CheA